MDAQRALLDELMGATRNLTEEEKKGFREIRWDDKEVCGFYMVFPLSFEKSSRHDVYVPRFEADLAQFCEKLVMDLDRKVRRGRERLAQEVEVPAPPPISAEKSEQLSILEEKIKKLLEQVESLGEAGKVDEAEALMKKVEMLNVEKTALTHQATNDKAMMLTQEKKMALCEICGSFLVANDAAERAQSHVTGKQHIGYGMVRDFIAEYKAAKEKEREEERLAREKEAEERRKVKEKESENRRGKERNSERERESERSRYRERGRSREWNDRGKEVDRRDNHYRNERDWGGRGHNGTFINMRGRDRGRIRSRSPVRHSYRRASRSPLRYS